MTTIHMQTETVHSTARQMEQTAAQGDALLQSFMRSLQELESTWQGGSSIEFSVEAQDAVRKIVAQNEQLAILAQRVEREVMEWEEVDQKGASSLQNAVGGDFISSGFNIADMNVTAPRWLVTSIIAVPVWLSSWLDKLFKPETVISPITEEQLAPVVNETTQQPVKSKLGELMEKAELERQAQEEARQQAIKKEPLPEHMVDYPARPDDGTYLAGQEKNDSCAIASTKMALNRVGVDVNESDLRDESTKIDGGYHNKSKWGTNPSSLDNLVNDNYGEKASATYNNPSTQSISNLDTAAENGEGIVVTVKNSEWFGEANAHSVTVVDVVTENGEQMVLVNDPWPPGDGKRIAVSVSEFESAWYGDAMYVTKKK